MSISKRSLPGARARARAILLAFGVAATGLPIAKPSAAQLGSSSWRFRATPYGWISGLGGQVGIDNLVANIDVGFSDLVKHLRFGAMAALGARKGALTLDADVIYVSLGDSRAFAIRGASGDVSFDQREAILQGAVGYALVDSPIWTVDVLVGARYWNLSTDIGIDPANSDARARSDDNAWVDATGGVRVHFSPASDFHLVADGDGGGGGARSTWRAAGTATFDLSARYGLMAGYKYLAVDYDRHGFLFDTQTKGWLAGVTFTF